MDSRPEVRLVYVVLLLAAGLGAQTSSKPVALSPQQEQEWRSRILATLFVHKLQPSQYPEFHGSFEPVPDVVAERVTYGTQFGMRVPAILYLPKYRSGKIPAIIVVNGHGGDKYSWYAFYSGILYARAGAAVLTFDMAGEGERNVHRQSGTRAHDMEWTSSLQPGQKPPPEQLARRLAGLMMTDVMEAVSYLGGRPEVDAQRISAVGYSVGSFVLALVCAVDLRLRACVLTGGGNLDETGGIWDRAKPLCSGVPYQSLRFLGDRPAAIYALHASRGATLVYNGLKDDVVGTRTQGEAFFEDLRKRTAQLRGSTNGIFETGFAHDGSHRPYFVTRPVALWLERQLDFPNWTEVGIRSMPDTHIGEWSRQKHVEMDAFYATEEREAGVCALGTDVPALSREQLSVFDEREWKRRKEGMIFETWLQRARVSIAAGGR